jgi:hypothetical protein
MRSLAALLRSGHCCVTTPKVQIFRGGKLVKEWEGDVPNLDEVRRALLTGTQGMDNSSGQSTQTPAGD